MILRKECFLAFFVLATLIVKAESVQGDQSYDFDPTFKHEMVAMDQTSPFFNAGISFYFNLNHALIQIEVSGLDSKFLSQLYEVCTTDPVQ